MFSLGVTNIAYCNDNSTTLWPRGCVSAFGNYIRSHAVSLGAAGVALCIIQVNCILTCNENTSQILLL